MSNIGERIKTMRLSRGMNQEELAKKLGVGRTAISNYESGFREPDLDTIEAMADIFNVSMGDLMGDTAPDPDEVWALREQLRDDPDRRALLNLARHGKAKDVRQVAALIDALRATNPEFYDGDDPS